MPIAPRLGQEEGVIVERPQCRCAQSAENCCKSHDDTARFTALLYDDLLREASRQSSHEVTGDRLQPTALLHESFLRLAGQRQTHWAGPAHFIAVARAFMRRVLIDEARARRAAKRGGHRHRITLSEDLCISREAPPDHLVVRDALEKLGRIDARRARIVELRFYSDMSNGEVAQAMELSLRTVEAEWAAAKAWLRRELMSDEYPAAG